MNLEEYLHTHIPITKAMGIAVMHASLDRVVLTAPFAPNINHKKTVFGGSLHAVLTMACWSILYLNLQKMSDSDVQIVITSSNIVYHYHVDSDFKAECVMPEKGAWEHFLKMLRAKGKARIKLSAMIKHGGKLAVSYQAVFAAIKI